MISRTLTSQAALLLAIVSLSACAKNAPPANDAPAEAEVPAEPEAPESAPLATPVESNESHYVEGVAGGVMTSTLQLEAEVISVDQEKREAVLKGPAGKEVTVRVGEGAVNFYQVKAGDRVNVTMARQLVIYVPDDKQEDAGDTAKTDEAAKTDETEKTDGAATDGTVVAAARAEEGASPAAAIVATSKVTGKVVALDLEARTATLSFEDGEEETFDIRPDVDMTKYKAGQEVVFLITELLALELKKL